MSGSTATTISEIPLIASPQSLNISLLGVQYGLLITWNPQSQVWLLDIADNQNNPLVQGIPMVTGTDLLGQYAYLGLGGSLFVYVDYNPDALPSFTDLGQQSNLYFVVFGS